jgi:replicative DNA helicase
METVREERIKDIESVILSGFKFTSDWTLLNYASSIFSKEDFITPQAQKIYEEILSRILKGVRPTDIDFENETPFAFESKEHINFLKEILMTEKLKEEILQVVEKLELTRDFAKVKELTERLARKAFELEQRIKDSQQICTEECLRELVEEIISESEQREIRENEFVFGLPTLESRISLNRGELLVIGARPGVGKTQLAIQFAIENVLEGKKVLFFSMEMTAKQLMERIISMGTNISLANIRRRSFTDDEKFLIREFVEQIKDNLIIVEGGKTFAQILLQTKAIKPDAVIVDYIQLIQGDKYQSEYEKISEAVNRLKTLAIEENLIAVALSQINRESEKGREKRPKLAYLKGSGQIEQTADTVLLLHSPEQVMRQAGKEVPEDLQNKIEIIVAKNRHKGFLGWLRMSVNPQTRRIEDIDALPVEGEAGNQEDLGSLFDDDEDLGIEL